MEGRLVYIVEYATWFVVGVDCLLEFGDPLQWIAGVEAVAPIVRHSAEWPLLSTRHVRNLGLCG
jgi:hypothetical protein